MVRYHGTDLWLREEGSDMQKQRLVNNGITALADADGNPVEDNYDTIREITPSPPRAQFSEDSVWSCCRYSRISRHHLLLLDYWVMEGMKGGRRRRGPGDDPDPYEMQYNKFVRDMHREFDHHKGYQPSAFYRLATRSRRLGYLLLSFTRKEKNIIDNETFTMCALRKGGLSLRPGESLGQPPTQHSTREAQESTSNCRSTGTTSPKNSPKTATEPPCISGRASSAIPPDRYSFGQTAVDGKVQEVPAANNQPPAVDSTVSDREDIPVVTHQPKRISFESNPNVNATVADGVTQSLDARNADNTYLSPNAAEDVRKGNGRISSPNIVVHEASPTKFEESSFVLQRRLLPTTPDEQQKPRQISLARDPAMPLRIVVPPSVTTTPSNVLMIGEHTLTLESTEPSQSPNSSRRPSKHVTVREDGSNTLGRPTSLHTRRKSIIIEGNSPLVEAPPQAFETSTSTERRASYRDSVPQSPTAQRLSIVLEGNSPIFTGSAFNNSGDIPTLNGDIRNGNAANNALPAPNSQDAEGKCLTRTRSIFVIIGWFPSELSEPVETCVIVDDLGHFLPDLKWHIMGLRGWRALLSFKSVQGFGLYRCRPQQLGHVSHHTTEIENLALAQFFQATSRSYRRANKPKQEGMGLYDPIFLKRRDSQAWAEWVHINLNNKRSCPFRSQFSLKLVLRWSQGRIALASLCPLVLSFAVGAWYAKAYNDVQTGFTVASYIVTAGAFIVALLAVLTALKDGPATPYPKVTISDDAV